MTVSCSIGIALYPQHGYDEITLAKNADDAMYRPRRPGAIRSGWRTAEPGRPRQTLCNSLLTHRLRGARHAFHRQTEHLAAIAGRSNPDVGTRRLDEQALPTLRIDSAQGMTAIFLPRRATRRTTSRRCASTPRAAPRDVSISATRSLATASAFAGAGSFQTTRRANYLQLGIKKGRRDIFINTPELLEQPEYAVLERLQSSGRHAVSTTLPTMPTPTC